MNIQFCAGAFQSIHIPKISICQIRTKLPDRILHANALKRRAVINILTLKYHGRTAANLCCQFPQHGFCQIHQVIVIGICPIEFQHGELGVMPC